MVNEDIKNFIRKNFNFFLYVIGLIILFFSEFDKIYNSSGNTNYLWVLIAFSLGLSIVMDRITFRKFEGNKIYDINFILLFTFTNLCVYVIYSLSKNILKDEIVYIVLNFFSKFYYFVLILPLIEIVSIFTNKILKSVDIKIFGTKNINMQQEDKNKKFIFFKSCSSCMFSTILLSFSIVSMFLSIIYTFDLITLQNKFIMFLTLIFIFFFIDLLILKISLDYNLKDFHKSILIILIAIASYYIITTLSEIPNFKLNSELKNINFIFKYILIFQIIESIPSFVKNKNTISKN